MNRWVVKIPVSGWIELEVTAESSAKAIKEAKASGFRLQDLRLKAKKATADKLN